MNRTVSTAGSVMDTDREWATEAAPPRLDGAQGLQHIFSIGDSEAELHAAWLATYTAGGWDQAPEVPAAAAPCEQPSAGRQGRRAVSAPPGPNPMQRPWIKTIKFEESPSVERLVEQLHALRRRLPQLVAAREHLHLEPETLAEVARQEPPMGGQGADMTVLRMLRTQSA
mmetsp:Transcript_13882/g.39619  ORF Transcript_13882/g.39619 Transcript_13882/m.39619 type:complete len:170 (-) Transcript_13882:9-518(-)